MTGELQRSLDALARAERDEDDEVFEILTGKYGFGESDADELIADARERGAATMLVPAGEYAGEYVTLAPDAWGITISTGQAIVLRPEPHTQEEDHA